MPSSWRSGSLWVGYDSVDAWANLPLDRDAVNIFNRAVVIGTWPQCSPSGHHRVRGGIPGIGSRAKCRRQRADPVGSVLAVGFDRTEEPGARFRTGMAVVLSM